MRECEKLFNLIIMEFKYNYPGVVKSFKCIEGGVYCSVELLAVGAKVCIEDDKVHLTLKNGDTLETYVGKTRADFDEIRDMIRKTVPVN